MRTLPQDVLSSPKRRETSVAGRTAMATKDMVWFCRTFQSVISEEFAMRGEDLLRDEGERMGTE